MNRDNKKTQLLYLVLPKLNCIKDHWGHALIYIVKQVTA